MGAETSHSRVCWIVHHPVNILLQQDRYVAGQEFEWLPVLYDGGVWKDPLNQVGGQIKPVDSRVVQTYWRGVGERGLDVSIQVGQTDLEFFGSEANQKNAL